MLELQYGTGHARPVGLRMQHTSGSSRSSKAVRPHAAQSGAPTRRKRALLYRAVKNTKKNLKPGS